MRSLGISRGAGPKVGVMALSLATVASLAFAGVTAAQDEKTINVAIVGNPQMEDIASLTPDLFTAETGINVEYTILEEQTLREIVTRDVGAGGEQFDVVMIGMFEAPQFGRNGWLVDLNTYAADDADYMVDDIIPAVRDGLSYDGGLYAAPFYAESSFVMYRKDVLEAAGVTMPDAPTWDEVAEIARAIDTDEMAGICLRGKPGWGDLGAIFTTVINTFGATWWLAGEGDTIGAAQIDQPEFKEALQFYVDLLADAGEDDAANSSYNECTNQMQDGKVAMWVDATVAASNLEADDSPIKGMLGYALSPTKLTDASGWLWAWALAIPENAPDKDAAWEYVQLGHRSGVPRPGRREPARRLGDRAPGHAPVAVREPQLPGSGRGLRSEDAGRHAGSPHQQPRHHAAPRPAGRAVRGRAPVPGCRDPLHGGVLRGDRRPEVGR